MANKYIKPQSYSIQLSNEGNSFFCQSNTKAYSNFGSPLTPNAEGTLNGFSFADEDDE